MIKKRVIEIWDKSTDVIIGIILLAFISCISYLLLFITLSLFVLLRNIGFYPLETATNLGWSWIVYILITLGADVNSQGKGGQTLLHIATPRYQNIMIFLIENGADVNAQNAAGNTPLHLVGCSYKKKIL